jgi:biopolymer transport protein ExbB/TolQ
VAIPAVIAFNYFRTRVKLVNRNVDALSQVLMSHLKGKAAPAERG